MFGDCPITESDATLMLEGVLDGGLFFFVGTP